MRSHNIGKLAVLATVVAGLTLAGSVSAAAPDGFGAWADGVAVSNQGLRKNGTAVLPDRSDPFEALGLAEGTQDLGTFFSLGFGGSTTFVFQNGISEGTFVVESTWDDFYYPTETAKVEISTNGLVYQEIGAITKEDGEVEIPDGFGCALFVRVTDTSNPDLYEDTADGFDVDGVRSVGEPCVTGGDFPNECTEFVRKKVKKDDDDARKKYSHLKSYKNGDKKWSNSWFKKAGKKW